jgi:hypothetical protein
VAWLYGTDERLCVICNDIFAWGCADAEPMAHADVQEVFRRVRTDPRWGAAKWCALKRNERPQAPVVRDMTAAGAWDDEMEALPANTWEVAMRAIQEPAP